jgi:hypothetical protein
MGAGESRFAGGALGLHVLRIAEGSPAAEAGLEPFFDFVIGAGAVRVVRTSRVLAHTLVRYVLTGWFQSEETDAFTAEIERNEGRPVTLQVWSSKRSELRGTPFALVRTVIGPETVQQR